MCCTGSKRIKMDYQDIKQIFIKVINAIDYIDYIQKLHDCNDCGIKNSCKYCPKLGQQVRINCPLWKEKK